MSGKELLKKFKPLLNFIEILTKFIPKFLFNLIYNMTSISEGKLSLLIRYLYVRKYSAECGTNIFIGRGVTLKNINSLYLGNNISIHANCYLDAYGKIIIGSNVSIANQTSIISFNHTYENTEMPIKYNPVIKGQILIEEDVWIGNGVRILPDLKVGTRSIVAAGAIVNKDVPARTIVGGVPAKVLKKI